MSRKMILLVCLVGLLGLVRSASAVDVQWTNGGSGDSWCTADNWEDPLKDPCVPGPNDNAIIDTDPSPVDGPTIDCDVNVGSITGPNPSPDDTQVMYVTGGTIIIHRGWDWSAGGDEGDGESTINISGSPLIKILGGDSEAWRASDEAKSILNISGEPNIFVEGDIRGADEGGSYFIWNMSGGYVWCDAVKCGDDGSGVFNFSGGTLEVVDDFSMRGRDGALVELTISGGALISVGDNFRVPEHDEAVANIYLLDGTIECGNFDSNPEAFWVLDINDAGLLRIKDNDMVEQMEAYVAEGKIIGRGGAATPLVFMDGSDTIVALHFDPTKATYPIPEHRGTHVCPTGLQLKWKPGPYADTHSIYFGSDMNDVNESADPCATLLDVNNWTVPYDLELGTTYYWRVDAVNDPCVWAGAIWRFTTEDGKAYDPSPANGYRRISTADLTLSWTGPCVADAHRVYFGTDLPASITLFEDDFEFGAFEPNWANSGWGIWDANDDPCWADFGEHDHNLARATGAGVKTLTSADIDTSDYAKAIQVRFFVRRTEAVTADDLELSYCAGSNCDVLDINDFNVVAFGPNETWYEFTDTITDSNYFISNFRIRLTANLDSGDDTVWIDDVRVSNSWPIDPQWFIQQQPADDTNYVPSVEPFVHYYWRVDEVIDGNVFHGNHWNFNTGFGGLLMYYKFDGTNPFPNPIQDDSDNDIEFYKYAASGSVTYGESNPIVNADDGTSADFEPNVGLYRDDPCDAEGWDLLRLDGTQYTIELWVKPEKLDEDMDDIYLIAKRNSWRLQLNDPGDDDEYRWTHAGNDETMDEGSAVVGEWAHLAAVYDYYTSDEDERMKFYLNGALEEGAGEDDLNPADNNYPVTIGYGLVDDVNVGGYFDGLIDEIRIYDIALTPCEFLLYPGPEWARCPSPYDTETDVDPCAPGFKLSWEPGIYADKHDIYFGTDLSAVGDLASPYVSNHDTNSWTPPTLELGKPYFWRVDEKTDDPCGGSPWKGEPWRFTTRLEIVDPNLILWYKFNEAAGEMALDSSGYGNHGDIDIDDDLNSPGWEPNNGHVDGCLKFDNDTGIGVPQPVLGPVSSEITVALWLNGGLIPRNQRGADMPVFDVSFEGVPRRMTAVVPTGEPEADVYWRAGNDSNDALTWNDATPIAWQGDWHHFAFVKDENEGTMRIYFDGIEAKSKTGTISSLSSIRYTPFRIGAFVGNQSDYRGKMDDFRVYDYALPTEKIEALFRGGDLERAWGPNPYDGQSDAPITTNLSWRRGDYAASHNVYFGTDWDEVNDANTSVHPNVDYNNVTDTNYTIDLLQLDTHYYWRVDEVNDTCQPEPWKGYVWRFKTADYIIIDDMEDYTMDSEYPITASSGSYGWECGIGGYGTGSYIDLVTPTQYAFVKAHGGDQAMAYVYWNSAAYYSEIANHFVLDPCDWDGVGLKLFTLWFYGDPLNDPCGETQQMYVGLKDSSGNYGEARYGQGEGEDMNDVTVEEWKQWLIPLSTFTTDNPSLDLSRMEYVLIGFGNRQNNSEFGVDGTVYIDDIRVYPPTCVLSERSTEFVKYDLYEDCVIDYGDIWVMADDWLKADVNLGEVTQPSDSNLIAWWTLDEGTGSDACDYSGNDHNGVIETIDTDVYWVAGRNDVNYALDFDSGRVRVADHPELRPLHKVSVSAWIKPSSALDDDGRIVVKGADNKETFALELGDNDRIGFMVRDGNDPNADNFPNYAAESAEEYEIDYGEWIHAAGTYDGNSIRCYVNGELTAVNHDANAIAYFGHPLSRDTNDLAIGNRSDDDNREFVGIIDDVRIYDYGLSAKEVAYLASDGTGIVAVESIANLIGGEGRGEQAVNFRDLAILGQSWLDEELYP